MFEVLYFVVLVEVVEAVVKEEEGAETGDLDEEEVELEVVAGVEGDRGVEQTKACLRNNLIINWKNTCPKQNLTWIKN